MSGWEVFLAAASRPEAAMLTLMTGLAFVALAIGRDA